MMVKAKQLVSERGAPYQQPQFGDRILENATVDPTVGRIVEGLRRDDVRDEDIRKWYNMPGLERAMIETADVYNRFIAFAGFKSQGMSTEDAGKAARKIHPVFGDLGTGASDDRHLPGSL